jgi:hypothetical protein
MWKIILLLGLLCLVGCRNTTGSEDACELSAIREYGQDNIVKFRKYNFLVFDVTDNSYHLISKMGINSTTTHTLNVTDFINSKLSEVK